MVITMLLTLGMIGVPSASAGNDKKLKVFILAGQSNMQGHAAVRTLPALAGDPAGNELLGAVLTRSGEPKVFRDVYVSYLTGGDKLKEGPLTVGFGALGREPKIGPELTFGAYAREYFDGPILIIKTAWGGKSLNTDFRPPSAGPYELPEAVQARWDKHPEGAHGVPSEEERPEWWEKKNEATGHYYRLMIDHVKKVLENPKQVHPGYNEKAGYEVAGLVWFQGWNDMVDRSYYPKRNQPDGYAKYTELLVHFIDDVRKDLSAPKMPVVIGVLGVGGKSTPESEAARAPRYRGIKPALESAMSAPARMSKYKDTVAAVQTGLYWDHKLEALDKRRGEVNKAAKEKAEEQNLDRHQRRALTEQMIDEAFTTEEKKRLAEKSNQGFHYMGSFRILGQIGKAFAQEMAKLHGIDPE
ncbi:MAG: sialate O-acetylesterase [Phycisphaeraceae bacterium]|nr:sialate O-acetylesterase [Phycisphaeraceae bacterium]